MDEHNERGDKVRTYRDLHVWQKAVVLTEEVYAATRAFPKDQIYGLTAQMRRAAVSIASNIAEGQGRQSRGEFLQFLGHARGSLAELGTQVTIAGRLGRLSPDVEETMMARLGEVGRMLNALRRSLKPPPMS
ncbi:MAG: four helix bundle protein [Pirellulales bacterium]